ncbi:MAG: class I SAM-dependent methyltransferase [Rhodospirillales bacterium]
MNDRQDAEEYVRKQADWLRAHGGKRALDVGCGTGRHALYLDTISYQVCATEEDETLLATARQGAKKQFGLVDFENAPPDQLPFADNGFDYVIAWNVLDKKDEAFARAVVSEIRRVLKPGKIFQGAVTAFTDAQVRVLLDGFEIADLSKAGEHAWRWTAKRH